MNDATPPITWPPGWGNTDDDDAACRAVAEQLGLAAPDAARITAAFAAARIRSILDRFEWISASSNTAEQQRRDQARLLRPGKKKREQKGVDVLLAVEMLHDAQAGNFSVGILLAGDADFVPLVDEVRRHGVIVIVVAQEATLAATLRQAADEVWPIDPTKLQSWAMELAL